MSLSARAIRGSPARFSGVVLFMSNMGVGPNGNPTGGAEGPSLRIQIVGQYVKDLSFENPGAPGNMTARPQIDLGVDLQARRLDAEHFEVELKLRVSAKAEDKSLFLLELAYAGLFMIQNAPEDIADRAQTTK